MNYMCQQCHINDNCKRKTLLDEIAKSSVQKLVETINNDAPKGFEYILISDIAITPKNCSSFVGKGKLFKEVFKGTSGFGNNNLPVPV